MSSSDVSEYGRARAETKGTVPKKGSGNLAFVSETLVSGECQMPDWKELRSVCLELAAEKHGPMPCAAGCNCRKCRDDAMFRSLERQNEFYQKNPRSIPGEGCTTPYGVEEQYRVEAEKQRRREAGVPE
jgi:hypothetical protein